MSEKLFGEEGSIAEDKREIYLEKMMYEAQSLERDLLELMSNDQNFVNIDATNVIFIEMNVPTVIKNKARNEKPTKFSSVDSERFN